jgi:transmembrane sensor
MSVNKDRIQYLFERYRQRTCSHEELQELFDCIAQPENRQLLEELMDAEYEVLQPLAVSGETDWDYIFQQAVPEKEDMIISFKKTKRFQWLRIAAAAIIVLALGAAGYWFVNRLGDNKVAQKEQKAPRTAEDILPGSNKAVLTLANGSVISLDSAGSGLLTEQDEVQVIKNKDGEVKYKAVNGSATGTIAYNSLSTPKGGQYHLILPDGSKVWLNAASSLRYPVTFAANERRVELNGEAYFEIAKDAGKPFHVVTATQDVEVLGTHFNVNAYTDEPSTKTTLLEGKVKIRQGSMVNGQSKTGNEALLQPGQQAVLSGSHSPFTIDHSPDLDLAMAWKNGFTAFNKADIKSIMRQVTRWYNVDVVYEGAIPQRSFTGGISRNARLSELLRLLEVSKVHFRIEGNTLIVTP